MLVIGLYLHVAFCRWKCLYCDINAHMGLDALIDRYVETLALRSRPGRPVWSYDRRAGRTGAGRAYPNGVRFTPRGQLLGNEVFQQFFCPLDS